MADGVGIQAYKQWRSLKITFPGVSLFVNEEKVMGENPEDKSPHKKNLEEQWTSDN